MIRASVQAVGLHNVQEVQMSNNVDMPYDLNNSAIVS
jgi:hypothetical protein